MKLTVFLGQNGSENFDIGLYNNSFVNKWLDELSWCLQNCEFDYNELFVNFLPLEKRKLILLEDIKVINEYLRKVLKKDFISLPTKVNWENQEIYNYLHLKFEEISGTFDNPSKLFIIAPKKIKQSIRNLNFYIHAIEGKKTTEIGNYFKFAFNKNQYRRMKFSIEDYDYFEHTSYNGGLYLSYSELGKNLYDIYKDNLTINYENYKNLKYFSGECFLNLGKTFSYENSFYNFCDKNSIDYKDKKLGIGFLKLGYIENSEKIKIKLQNNQFLHSIKIER